MAEKPRYPLPQLPPRPLGFSVPVNDLPIPGTFIPQPPPRKTIDEIMRSLSYGISQDIGQAGSSVARALMTPGNALRGGYNEVSIYPSGYVSPVSEALIQDASNMAGVVTTGAMPLPRPSGSLAMGSARILPDMTPENFPIRANQPFPYMHNTEGAYNYVPKGSAATSLDPKGRFVIHGEGGKAPDARWISGEMEFKNPLIIEWDGWKERISSAYGGATGEKLTKMLKADGYDGIVTFDKWGPSEIVELK